ncbi:hypothetical protein T484DRAFT_1642549, partial [Baffinella frigidus]
PQDWSNGAPQDWSNDAPRDWQGGPPQDWPREGKDMDRAAKVYPQPSTLNPLP